MIEIVKCFGKQKFQTIVFPADPITLVHSDFTANTGPVNIWGESFPDNPFVAFLEIFLDGNIGRPGIILN